MFMQPIEYNHLQDVPTGGIEQLENNIARQKDIINTTLYGASRDKALQNLAANRASSFNALNPEIQQKADQNQNVPDIYQTAGMETLKNFDPVKYEQYNRYLNTTDVDPTNPDSKIFLEKVKKDLLDIGTTNTLKYLQEHQAVLNTQYQNASTDQEKEALASQWKQNKGQIQES